MKNLLFFILLFGVLNLMGQENIEVKISKLAIDSEMQSAFVVEIPQANSKDAIKIWEDQLVPRNLFDTFKKLPKMEKEDKDKWYINGVVIDAVSPDTLSVFTRITTLKDRILFAASFKSENGFIGNDPSNTSLVERTSSYLRSYAIEAYRQAVQNELDGLEKDLKKMENDYSGYEKDNRKLNRKTTKIQSNLNTLVETNPLNSPATSATSEEQIKEIKKEEKALKKHSKQVDKNENKQDKLAREIKKKQDEIKDVKQKLRKIK
ncbi:MAG TPA: hypothetical protein PK335_01445 [Draconibacterium sp.]|nr:hypothetical protein [Draconibacterium sp.]